MDQSLNNKTPNGTRCQNSHDAMNKVVNSGVEKHFSSVILAASVANLQPCLACLLNCSSISSFLILCSTPMKISKVPCTFSCTSSQCTTQNHSVRFTLPFSILAASRFCFSFFLLEISFTIHMHPTAFRRYTFTLRNFHFLSSVLNHC